MSDLEDDLLALAGGDEYDSEADVPTTRTTSKSRSTYNGSGNGNGGGDESESDDEDTVLAKKRRRVDSGSNDYDDEVEGRLSPENDDEDDDEEDEEEDDYDPDAGTGYEPEENETELVNPYPIDGKYKDEADRDELEAMDEMKREEILFERSQEMDKYNERRFLQQRIKKQQQQQQQQQQQLNRSDEKLRTSSRNKTVGARSHKENKLSELKKQREKHSRKRTRAQDDYDDDDDDAEEDSDDSGLGEEELLGEEAYEDDEFDEFNKGGVSWGGVSKTKRKKLTEPGKYEDILRISMTRSVLAQYCYHPNFQNVMIGTYAKVAVSFDRHTGRQFYRMVKIEDIRARPEKPFRIGNSKYDMYFLVSQNREQKMPFPMSTFSDSIITREEYDKYLGELAKTGESIDLLDDIKEKVSELSKFYKTGITDKDINERIARKQQMQQKKGAYTAFEAVQAKSRLMEELKIFKQRGDLEGTQRIINELKHIDEILDQKTLSSTSQSQIQSIAKVNERNRKLNSTNIRKAELKFKTDASTASFDGGDPFSRLKTNTRMFYQDLINRENAKALQDVNMQKLIDEKSKQEEQIAQSTYRDLGEMDKLIRLIDIDIELMI